MAGIMPDVWLRPEDPFKEKIEMMKIFLFLLPVVFLATACDTRNQSALTGAATGAALGAAVSGDDDRVAGALIGGAAGAAAGSYLGRAQGRPGDCVYERPDGSRYVAPC